MRRVKQLVDCVRAAHPRDTFFSDFELSVESWPLKRRFYEAYERAFAVLDDRSWENLREKAVGHFHETRPRQLKGPFFDQLNDAFACQWLVRRGLTEVTILAEQRNGRNLAQCPDISFCAFGRRFYCDAKTIVPSILEHEQRSITQYRNSSRYEQLHPTFLKKIDDAITAGTKQIRALGNCGLIFLLVNFDDFTMTYYAQHRTQIRAHLLDHRGLPYVIRFGLLGGRRIESTRVLFSQMSSVTSH